MTTLADRILAAIRHRPLDDDQLAKRLRVPHRQAVNQAAHRLENDGRLRRYTGTVGKIVNALSDFTASEPRHLSRRNAWRQGGRGRGQGRGP